MSDLEMIGRAFAVLRQEGWLAKGGFACCNSCSKAELFYDHDDPQEKVAYWNDNDAAFAPRGIITERSFGIKVLGDVERVASELRLRFGGRVWHVQPMTDEQQGSVDILPRDTKGTLYEGMIA